MHCMAADPPAVPHLQRNSVHVCCRCRAETNDEQDAVQCMAVLSMQQCIVGVLLPTLIAGSIHLRFATPFGAFQESEFEEPGAARRTGLVRCCTRGWQAVLRAARQTWNAADAGVADFCTGHNYPAPLLERGIAVTLLSSTCWLVCKAAAVYQAA